MAKTSVIPHTHPQQSQLNRFKEAARKLGCVEDEAAFDEKLKGIARQKPLTPEKETPPNKN